MQQSQRISMHQRGGSLLRTPNRMDGGTISMGPNELNRILSQTSRTPHNAITSLNMSYSLHRTALPADTMSLSERSAVDSAMEPLQEQLMLKEKTGMLFPQFLEILQSRTNESEVFDTIQDLVHVCTGVQEEIERDLKRTVINTKQKQSDITWLEQEIKTWKLLHALYKDRIVLQAEVDVMDTSISPLGASEKEVIAQLYTNNSMLREYQLIVDWLEACYKRVDNGPQVGHSTDRTVAWENTLFQLKNQKEVAFGTGVEIVKSLDPDAPIREKRPLHALDEEDNMRLSKCIFLEIRQGRIDEAMALCKYCGQTWRAALLEGWRLHEDPNYEMNLNTKEKLPIEGNPRRDLWKKCAWLMADSKKFDEYTRAIAGAFCGHLESLKALLSNSWEDLLWSYLKVQIDIRVESEIRTCCIKSYLQMPEEYWNAKMTLDQIFDELTVHSDAAVRDYATSKIGKIQKYLMLDNMSELLVQIREWLANADHANDTTAPTSGTTMSPHFLRFLTHIVLFMKQIGRIDKEETADLIVAAYVECLIGMKDAQLVAFYTAALPGRLQVELYSKFLEGIEESSMRATALEEAVTAGLDVESIMRHTVDTLRQRMHNAEDASVEARQPLQVGEISAFDKRKINALEWLTFLSTQRGDLLWQANAMIRYFLGEGKTECVRAAFDMVPLDSITQILNIYGSKDNLPSREECSIKEYLSYKVYLTALDCFNDWSRLYHNRPKEPEAMVAGANFTERIASEHKEQTYRLELNRWKMNLEEQARVTRDSLFNLLVFPEKGWLIDPDTTKDHDTVSELNWENRQLQMERLRSICIPEIVLLLHKVLHLSGDFKGCITLADELASETRQIYKVYTKHKLAELLTKLAETSSQLLNQKLDPWGFPPTI